jgi:hypothetical protein
VLSRLVDDLTDVLDHLDAPPDSDADDTALRSRATAAPQGVHVNAVESGHMVPFTEPRLIAEEVLRVVEIVAEKP